MYNKKGSSYRAEHLYSARVSTMDLFSSVSSVVRNIKKFPLNRDLSLNLNVAKNVKSTINFSKFG